LRRDNEPARHKLLDFIGDLALVGRPVLGRFSAAGGGHTLNVEMARALRAGLRGLPGVGSNGQRLFLEGMHAED
jgi:UDP-3-O-[3-hydroxymyristoyl] N-acetylglucosamine deacetylase/3-hydroxyacyl-[acyl-carrier-protein] dehydratase